MKEGLLELCIQTILFRFCHLTEFGYFLSRALLFTSFLHRNSRTRALPFLISIILTNIITPLYFVVDYYFCLLVSIAMRRE